MISIPPLKTAVLIFVATVMVFYGIGGAMVYSSVAAYVHDAQSVYGGDPVTALIALLEDESAPFDKRNSAIWALGQIGDERALPALQQLRTTDIQKRPYDSSSYIVQYSVDKAIRQINGFHTTQWMYRWLE